MFVNGSSVYSLSSYFHPWRKLISCSLGLAWLSVCNEYAALHTLNSWPQYSIHLEYTCMFRTTCKFTWFWNCTAQIRSWQIAKHFDSSSQCNLPPTSTRLLLQSIGRVPEQCLQHYSLAHGYTYFLAMLRSILQTLNCYPNRCAISKLHSTPGFRSIVQRTLSQSKQAIKTIQSSSVILPLAKRIYFAF